MGAINFRGTFYLKYHFSVSNMCAINSLRIKIVENLKRKKSHFKLKLACFELEKSCKFF